MLLLPVHAHVHHWCMHHGVLKEGRWLGVRRQHERVEAAPDATTATTTGTGSNTGRLLWCACWHRRLLSCGSCSSSRGSRSGGTRAVGHEADARAEVPQMDVVWLVRVLVGVLMGMPRRLPIVSRRCRLTLKKEGSNIFEKRQCGPRMGFKRCKQTAGTC